MKILTIALLFIPVLSFAQIHATTVTGKKVILNQDGTWKYYTVPTAVKADLSECKYMLDEVDQFSGERKVVTKDEPIGKTDTKVKVYVNIRRVADAYGFQISSLVDLGCIISEKSTLSIKFTDGEVIKLLHAGKTDCSNINFLSVFLDQDAVNVKERAEEVKNKMKSTPIEAMRMQGSEYYTDITIDDPAFFQKRIPCVEID